MRRHLVAPLLWGFFLSGAYAAHLAPQLKSTVPDRIGGLLPAAPAAEIHARILAIRIQFLPDTLSTTTGNGTFNTGIPDSITIDPLPHDRAYFEDHLRFLDNYFTDMSNGKATVDTFAVFPSQPDSAYVLPNQMWHYNYNSTPEDLNLRLAWLFRDAWQAAADDPAIHPENFNTFFIFHAGVGKDFALSFDETPHDIPSAYFTLSDLRESLSDPTFPGVLVNGTYIGEGLLLPESEYQPEVNADIAMNGTEALLFAHSLGLPALYNTDNGNSGVGRFDLMDQGSGNFAGLVPSRPCAWSRAFMGWQDPVLIQPTAVPDTFWVNVPGFGDSTQIPLNEIYRVNLNESEYYLIENRSWDPDSLGHTIAYDSQNRRLQINEDYSINLLDGDFGVIVRVDNYDFGIPGEGVLIWHVDDSVIEAKYAENRINTDLTHGGVALVEADGAQDIGQTYGFFDVGYGTELGWAGDFFFGGNAQYLAANPQISSVIFYDDSHPGTRTYDNSPTGLSLGGFNEPDTVMRFWVKNSWAQEGFPVQLADSPGSLSPSALDFDADGKTDWIFAVTPDGAVQAFDSLGRAQGMITEAHWLISLLGDSTQMYDTLLVRLDSIATTPALDVGGDGFFAVIPSADGKIYQLEYATDSGTLALDSLQLSAASRCAPLMYGSASSRHWMIGDDAGTVSALTEANVLVWQRTLFDNEPIIGLCLSDSSISAPLFMLTAQGGAALVSQSGDTLWTRRLAFNPTFAPISVYQQKYARWDLVAVGGSQIALLDPATGNYRPGFPLDVGMIISVPPAAADFDRDGRMEILLAGANRILCVAANGTLAANWPLLLDARRPVEPILSPPAISEVGFDGELRAFFGWPNGSVDARDRWGKQTEGFSRSTGSRVASAPLLVQLDSDPETELLAVDESGALYAWHLEQLGDYDAQRRPWNGYQNGNLRQGWAMDNVDIIPLDQSVLVTTKVYPWPNPANDVSHIRFLMGGETGQSGKVTVRIFDGAGDLVKEISTVAEVGIEGDLEWNLADVTSGVYLGRVAAEVGGKTERTFIKIAVVK